MDTMLEIAKRVDAFLMELSPVHDTMRRLAKAFDALEIAIAGAMAANAHGRRRTTVDVLIVGDYPGDGKPKPISFPTPESAR